MKALFFATVVLFAFASCKKPDSSQSSPRALLIAHKWYYHVFTQDGLHISLSYCDTNNYLLFSDGNNGGIGNDFSACYGKSGIISTFTYTFSPDSNIIHVKNFGGGDYTWQVMTLNSTTLRIAFTASTPPPAFAPNFDYIYTTR